MKAFALVIAAAVVVRIAWAALPALVGNHAALAHQVAAPERPLVFVPGLLGSMLCRPGADGENTTVWGTVDAMEQFPTLAVTSGDDIEPCGLIREISYLGLYTQTVYGPFIDRLEQAGYREGETLFIFDYDWRLSILENARRLAGYVEETIPGPGAIDVVGHSMGGLVARTYALNEGGAQRIARLVSAGSPWRGSVQVFELLQGGWGLANSLLGGLDAFRRTVISFPSTFELMPHYDGCCGDAREVAFDATNLEAWTSLNWTGIETSLLPDLTAIEARQAQLLRIVATPLPAAIEEALVIGVDQRTPQQYELVAGDGEARFNVTTSWDGDGTVMRDSAELAQRVIYPTSFATHDAILSDASVQDFVLAALRTSPAAAIKTVPVRERTSILTALGEFVELVGVAIDPDQPVYATGSTATVTVHLRLGIDAPVDASAIKVSIALPDGTTEPMALALDPHASDPANPLEQSFSAAFPVGDAPGELTITASIDDNTATPRVVTRIVPVVQAP